MYIKLPQTCTKSIQRRCCFVLLFFLAVNWMTQAQDISFAKRTGTDNPLSGIVLNAGLTSKSVDIDADGDMDLFVGNQEGTVRYYKNIGTSEDPNVFEEQLGAENPFDGVDIGSNSTPTFVDFNQDNLMDVFVGGTNGIAYFKNTGTTMAPVFEQRQGEENPLGAITYSGNRVFSTTFTDIDLDGDQDVFVGWIDYDAVDSCGILYYKNTGSGLQTTFVNQSGADNPFETFQELYPTPVFVDVDSDQDLDVFIAKGDGSFSYFENTTDPNELSVEKNALQSFVVYPNPAVNEFLVVLKDKPLTLRMFALTGHEVLNRFLTTENSSVDVRSFPAGIYILIFDDGVNRSTQKVIITR